MADDLSDLKKADLIELAESLDLATGGTVKALRARIEAAQEPADEPEPEAEPEAVVEADDGDSDRDFVKQAYLDILKREADPSGLSGYVAALGFHGTLTREEVLEQLKNSAEAKAL